MTDLFRKPTMRERVLEFCKEKGYTTSIDLQNLMDNIKHEEGIVPGLLRIHREARQLSQDGILKRLDAQEKDFRGFNKKFAVYEFIT